MSFIVSFGKITTFARTEQFIGNKLTEFYLIRINNIYSFIYFLIQSDLFAFYFQLYMYYVCVCIY